MGIAFIELLLHSGPFIFEALVFSAKTVIFMVMVVAIYNVVILLLSHLMDTFYIWMAIFFVHFVLRSVYCYNNNSCFQDPDSDAIA